MFSHLIAKALSPDDSARLIREILRFWGTHSGDFLGIPATSRTPY
jgi:hypothetical protein